LFGHSVEIFNFQFSNFIENWRLKII